MSNWHRAAAKIVLAHRPHFGLYADGTYETICECGELWKWKGEREGVKRRDIPHTGVPRPTEDEWEWANHVGAKLESQMPIGSGRGTRHREVA